MLRTIPRQLTLSHVAVVLVCLALAGTFVVDFVRSQYQRRLEESLLDQGTSLATLLARQGWPPQVGAAERRVMSQAMIELSADRIVLVDTRGEVLADSSAQRLFRFLGQDRLPAAKGDEWPLRSPEMGEALQGRSAAFVRNCPPSDPLPGEASEISALFAAVPVTVGHRTVGVLALYRPLADLDLLLLTLKLGMAWAGLVSFGLSLALAVFLSRLLTRPIRRLTRAADRVAAGHLEERLDLSGTQELAQLATSFNRMAEALEQHDRTRGQFLADASHELRTPLASLKVLADALDAGALEDPAKGRHFLGYIRREIARLETLVQDLLDLHKMEAGALELCLRDVDVARLVEDVAGQVAPTLPAGCLQVTMEGPCHADCNRDREGMADDVPPTLATGCLEAPLEGPWHVACDRDRVRQVLLNLLENARRAVEDRPAPLIRLVLSREGDSVVLTVQDNGCGIPDADLERVFERFHRVDPGRSRQSGGTGLGLAIARRILDAHGGTIRAEHAPGGGTRIQCTLKAAPAPTGPDAPPATS